MKAILAACLLAACAFAFAIGLAQADDGGTAAAPRQGAPATQPVQQDQRERQRPRDDCPEKDEGGGNGSQGSSGSSGSEQQF
jgi:hypothetical protein